MKRTILLADDSSTIQRLVERTFESTDFTVVAFSNGEAALRRFEELSPAAVLADIHMPGKNGYEVCAFVRQHPHLSRTPVVLLVGAFEVFDQAQADHVGASGTITKPFEPKQLVETVADLVREHSPKAGSEAVPGAPGGSRTDAAEAIGEGDADSDILGLRDLFPGTPAAAARRALSEEEVDAIADRVIKRLSTEVVESIAWDIVPEIADRVMRDELKGKE
jgi:CheY-like chemotaxis protein